MNVFARTLAAICLTLAPSLAQAENTAAPPENTAVDGLTFPGRRPLRQCHDTKCFGIGAVRRAFEVGQLSSVVMYSQQSCDELNSGAGDVIPCTVDEDAPGSDWFPSMSVETDQQHVWTWNCHSLKCFGQQVIEDLDARKMLPQGISFHTRKECEELERDILYKACRGDDDTRLFIKPMDDLAD